MDLKIQPHNLLYQLTKKFNYSPSTMILFKQLTKFISDVIQDETCMNKQSHENHLHDLLCNFSFTYTHIPTKSEELQKHAALVNNKKLLGEGTNGRIYKSGIFQGNPIVTKTKKKLSNHTIYDIYVNFVIINSFLLQNQLEYNLIPSYGIFLCSTNENGTEICLPSSKQKHIFLVQKEITGTTLSKQLPTITVERFKEIVTEILHVLITFENSVYRLYHTDLHASNIIMAYGDDHKEHPVLLDFELCSFTVMDEENKPYRFRLNSVENKYCNKEYITSGAHDIILLFAHASAFRNPDLHTYCMKSLYILCKDFLKDINDPYVISADLFKNQYHRWIYDLLYECEEKLQEPTKSIVHKHNIKILKKMSYQFIKVQLEL